MARLGRVLTPIGGAPIQLAVQRRTGDLSLGYFRGPFKQTCLVQQSVALGRRVLRSSEHFYGGRAMSSVSHHFGLGIGPFEFVDVDVLTDRPIFLDPSAIRRGADGYSRSADALLVGFFQEILRCARSSATVDQTHGLQLLQSLHEPNETRLGYSVRGSRGHAFADGMGKEFWDAIVANRALRSTVSGSGSSPTISQAVLSRLEDVALFLDRVDKDMISDLATRVAYSVLAQFTNDMMAKYPNLASSAVTHNRDIWDPGTRMMVATSFSLPSVSGSDPLLLVPRPWVDKRLAMNATAFYNRFATQVLQDETAGSARGGRSKTQSKQSIKAMHPHVKKTNTEQAAKYAETHGRNLVGEYRAWTDGNVDPISDADLAARLL